MSLLTRKGKRWPDLSKDPQRYSRPSGASSYQQSSHIPVRESNVATDLFSITGIDIVKGARTAGSSIYQANEVIKINQPPSSEENHHHVRHHRRKNGRRHVLRDQPSVFENRPTDLPENGGHTDGKNNQLYGSTSATPYQEKDQAENKNSDHKEEKNPGEKPTVGTHFPTRCQQGEDSNCTARFHFPSSVLMIEAHYNQTVRDFLQICTPVERVEIDGLDDLQVLLSALYQQMPVNRASSATPSSIVLLFNLEHYANWTKERVIDVLQATVTAFHNDFDDMMIYSKFHQDGADSNDTHLSLTYDVKYWLSNLCNERLTPCADFASIILESVLQMNEIQNEGMNNDSVSDATFSMDDASTQANA